MDRLKKKGTLIHIFPIKQTCALLPNHIAHTCAAKSKGNNYHYFSLNCVQLEASWMEMENSRKSILVPCHLCALAEDRICNLTLIWFGSVTSYLLYHLEEASRPPLLERVEYEYDVLLCVEKDKSIFYLLLDTGNILVVRNHCTRHFLHALVSGCEIHHLPGNWRVELFLELTQMGLIFCRDTVALCLYKLCMLVIWLHFLSELQPVQKSACFMLGVPEIYCEYTAYFPVVLHWTYT